MTTQSTPTEQLFASFVALLLDTLATMVPAAADSGDTAATRRDIARLLFEAFNPRDAIEAMLAARAVAMHHATMDSLARAAEPGTTDEKAIRLNARAAAASRAFDAALRTLEKRRVPPPQPRAESPRARDGARKQAPAQRAPAVPEAPIRIPGWREPTRKEQRRAAYRDTTALTTIMQRPPLAEHLAASGSS